jgi:ABC-type oligopeptide transport system ATPase subunit
MVMMDFGRIVEEGPAARMFSNPQHERTKEFFSKIL